MLRHDTKTHANKPMNTRKRRDVISSRIYVHSYLACRPLDPSTYAYTLMTDTNQLLFEKAHDVGLLLPIITIRLGLFRRGFLCRRLAAIVRGVGVGVVRIGAGAGRRGWTLCNGDFLFF